MQRCGRCIYRGLGHGLRRIALFELLAGDCPALPQLCGAGRLAAGQRQLAAHAGQLGLCQLYAGLVGARINHKKHVTFLDQFAFLKVELIDVATDPRPQFHGLWRFDSATESAPQGYRLGANFSHLHLGRRGCCIVLGLALGIATSQGEQQQEAEQCHFGLIEGDCMHGLFSLPVRDWSGSWREGALVVTNDKTSTVFSGSALLRQTCLILFISALHSAHSQLPGLAKLDYSVSGGLYT